MRVTRASSGSITELEEGIKHQFVCCVCGLTHDFMFAVRDEGRGKKKIALHIWDNDAQTQKEFNKIQRKLKVEGLPEVARRVKAMKDVA